MFSQKYLFVNIFIMRIKKGTQELYKQNIGSKILQTNFDISFLKLINKFQIVKKLIAINFLFLKIKFLA